MAVRLSPRMELFIHIFLIRRTQVPFVQAFSGVYTSPFLDTDELKIALRAGKVSGAFEKRPLGQTMYVDIMKLTLILSLGFV